MDCPEVRIELQRHTDAARFRLLARALFDPPDGHRKTTEQIPVSARDNEPAQGRNAHLHEAADRSRSEEVNAIRLEETAAPLVKSQGAV